jgi:hypothetical protein
MERAILKLLREKSQEWSDASAVHRQRIEARWMPFVRVLILDALYPSSAPNELILSALDHVRKQTMASKRRAAKAVVDEARRSGVRGEASSAMDRAAAGLGLTRDQVINSAYGQRQPKRKPRTK